MKVLFFFCLILLLEYNLSFDLICTQDYYVTKNITIVKDKFLTTTTTTQCSSCYQIVAITDDCNGSCTLPGVFVDNILPANVTCTSCDPVGSTNCTGCTIINNPLCNDQCSITLSYNCSTNYAYKFKKIHKCDSSRWKLKRIHHHENFNLTKCRHHHHHHRHHRHHESEEEEEHHHHHLTLHHKERRHRHKRKHGLRLWKDNWSKRKPCKRRHRRDSIRGNLYLLKK